MKSRKSGTTYSLAAAVFVAVVFTAYYFIGSFRAANDITSQPKTLDRGLIGEPESLDHHNFSSDQAAQVLRDTGEGLLAIGADGSLRPGVAESWNISDDGLRYQFEIRADATWSNGSRITAQDFVSTYRKLVDPARAAINANAIRAVKNAEEIIGGDASINSLGVTAVTDHLLEIQLGSPTPYFLQLLTHPSLYPVFLPSTVGIDVLSNKKISNGAYVIQDWTKGSEISLSKNPTYWDAENVYFESVRYHIVSEGAEFNRFRAGELDITGTVDSGTFPIAKRDYSGELKVAPRLGVYYYGFNLSNPVFAKNRNLRHALSLAIDRQLLVDKIIARGEKPAFSWVPPGTHNYTPQISHDLELDKENRVRKAKRLYEEAGYGPANVLKFQLRYNKSDVQERIALAVSSMWRDVLGAEVELVSEEFQVLLENIRSRQDTDVFRLSWTGNYNDPQAFLDLFESAHSQNLTGYSNREFDELMRAARMEVNKAKRKSILESAERIALHDSPVIPIYFYVSKHLVSPRINGWIPNVMDIHPSQHLWASPEPSQ